MDIFRSDKAPYVIGLLVTILGWHISQLADDVRSAHAVTYSVHIHSAQRTVVARIHNVSKTKSLPNVTFSLACSGTQRCLDAKTAFINVEAPNGLAGSEFIPSDGALLMVTTLAAGGRLEIGAGLRAGTSPPKLIFVPDPAKPLDIYLMESASVRGFIVEYYVEIVFVSFLLLLALLVALAIGNYRAGKVPAPAQEGRK